MKMNFAKKATALAMSVLFAVSMADDCRNVVETVMKKYGRIDVLANVAGVVGTRGAFVDLDLADIQNTI